jgi:6-pyruvoyltetrahydropterin/6-carboxytetrahydropterin synthase
LEIYKDFRFDSAHRLPHVAPGHKCGRLHGHTFQLRVVVSGPVGEETGWILDFGDLKAVVKPLIAELDHTYLNDIEGLENPTSEVLVQWVWTRLKPILPQLSRLEMKETCSTGCVYWGPTGSNS